MRSPPLVLLLLCFVALPVFLTFFSLLYSHPRNEGRTRTTTTAQRSGLRAFFSFHTPSALFPPSAIISLTDDNSTFFLAKPAAFGPSLPSDGLSGQLWVGSGFGDDSLGKGGAITGAEGELGCSDVPGFGDGNRHHHDGKNVESIVEGASSLHSDKIDEGKDKHEIQQRSNANVGLSLPQVVDEKSKPDEDDGTDDHLHHPLPGSHISKPGQPGQSAEHEYANDGRPEHADIQSLQESAEIAGKVVILSRGGCGFLEKVMWVQRRGGVALIVGDNERGGPILTMYARGDSSNVSIPSLFTSRTTAHLLSSLIPPLGTDKESVQEGHSRRISGKSYSNKVIAKKKKGKKGDSPTGTTFTPATAGTKPTGIPRPSILPASDTGAMSLKGQKKTGWLRSLVSVLGLDGRSSSSGLPADSRRPPSSGRINWIISDSWNEEPATGEESRAKSAQTKEKSSKSKSSLKSGVQQNSGDDFVIGVHDWRDPDVLMHHGTKSLVGKGKSKTEQTATRGSSRATNSPITATDGVDGQNSNGLTGGSITPGSGEYQDTTNDVDISVQNSPHGESSVAKPTTDNKRPVGRSWLSRLIWGSPDQETIYSQDWKAQEMQRKKPTPHFVQDLEFVDNDEDYDVSYDHDGLWVTLTPTTISTSPFFDTLLVLVVSPLVTLTVVYALLLLRSRIRRRRWRAPKSVVDRLPVRTYHTMSCASSRTSSQLPSPNMSSPTSPLLHSSPRSVLSRSRPRSQTTSGIGESVSASLDNATVKASLSQREKVDSSVPKRRYNGKQVECVVCLEEYVDGQSRVMSLPCGHEFHAECM